MRACIQPLQTQKHGSTWYKKTNKLQGQGNHWEKLESHRFPGAISTAYRHTSWYLPPVSDPKVCRPLGQSWSFLFSRAGSRTHLSYIRAKCGIGTSHIHKGCWQGSHAHMQAPRVQASMNSRKIKSNDCVHANNFSPVIPFSGIYSERKKRRQS